MPPPVACFLPPNSRPPDRLFTTAATPATMPTTGNSAPMPCANEPAAIELAPMLAAAPNPLVPAMVNAELKPPSAPIVLPNAEPIPPNIPVIPPKMPPAAELPNALPPPKPIMLPRTWPKPPVAPDCDGDPPTPNKPATLESSPPPDACPLPAPLPIPRSALNNGSTSFVLANSLTISAKNRIATCFRLLPKSEKLLICPVKKSPNALLTPSTAPAQRCSYCFAAASDASATLRSESYISWLTSMTPVFNSMAR